MTRSVPASSDRVAALDTDHRRDPSGGGDPLDVVGRPGELEPIGVAADELEERVDLLERHGHGAVRRQVRGHVHRPELAAHAACGHARQVGHEGGVGRIAALPKLPQQVVVAVDEGSGAKEIEHGRRMLAGHLHRHPTGGARACRAYALQGVTASSTADAASGEGGLDGSPINHRSGR